MTTHTTFIYIRTSSDSKLAGGFDPEMTTPDRNPPLSVLSNSTNIPPTTSKSHSSESQRKPNERTISGVFAYTNAADVETGFPDHKLEHIRALKSNTYSSSASSAGGSSNGAVALPNGSLKGGLTGVNGSIRPRSHSKSGSIGSMGSSTEKGADQSSTNTRISRNLDALEPREKLANGDGAPEASSGISSRNGDNIETRRMKPPLPRGLSEGSMKVKSDAVQLPSGSNTGRAQPAMMELSTNMRQPGTSVHRFSSPPRMSQMSSSTTDAAPRLSISQDAPRLIQRHTLTVPRTTGARDFSFSTGDEVISATGRFSPSRDNEPPTPRHRRPSLGLVRRTTRSMASDAYPDEVPPDEDAARWTELIKQKRASRRKRREEEDDERVIVGKKVEEGHVNWVTAYNMLTGIRFTVSRTNAKMDRELTDADFSAKHKFSFDITGNELTPSAKYDFKFKDYSPWVFRHLRNLFNLDPADYLMSLTSKYILSELGSPGKSGSFFYFSRDYKYIIKTIHHAEHKLLRHILRDYYNHVRDNPNTLISQFYGLHRVKIPYGRKIHFVVMNNLFPPHRDIHQTFDLKGSTIGRDFKEEDLENNPRATLKDLNWLRRDYHLEFQAHVKKMFLDQMQKDVALLQRLHIMDYSLLVGMHDSEKGNEENVRETILQVFQPGGERDEDGELRGAPLLRTPSRLESARKARELRQTLKREKPTPMSLVAAKMPDQMTSTDERKYRIFYSDDGGIRATHEDGSPSDTIYYLGIIDCLTRYGFVKRIEHFWKGMSHPRTQISPIPPQNYGERFINFITGITMTQEEAERRKTMDAGELRESVDAHNALHHHHIPSVVRASVDAMSPTSKTSGDDDHAPRSPVAVDQTMKKAQLQAEKSKEDRRLSEDELPDRKLKTLSVPLTGSDRGPDVGRNSATLPVVEEMKEGSSDVSSRKSDRTGSESREGERAGSVNGNRNPSDIRPVSASTIGQATSQEESQVSEKSQLYTPASEYFTPTSPNFSRPIPHSPNLHPAAQAQPQPQTQTQPQHRDKPPRISSGIIPRLDPLYNSPELLDPEKSLIGADGELVPDVEKMARLNLDDTANRNTIR